MHPSRHGQVRCKEVTTGWWRRASAGGEQQSLGTPQAARRWARPPCRLFKTLSCCCCCCCIETLCATAANHQNRQHRMQQAGTLETNEKLSSGMHTKHSHLRAAEGPQRPNPQRRPTQVPTVRQVPNTVWPVTPVYLPPCTCRTDGARRISGFGGKAAHPSTVRT
jgi:hypothetical protein